MTSRVAALALALSLLYSRGSFAAPVPLPLTDALRQAPEAVRLSFLARVAETDEEKKKQKKDNTAVVARGDAVDKGKQSESGSDQDAQEGQAENDAKEDGSGRSGSGKKQDDGKVDNEEKQGKDLDSRGAGRQKDSGESIAGAASDSATQNGTKADASIGGGDNGSDGDDGEDGDERSRIGRMTTSEMIAEARAHSSRLMKGGFIQFVEWLFVFILVAPGTFPAIGCVLLSCTSFWRRRLASANTSVPTTNSETISRAVGGDTQSAYQRVPHGDHNALVARARVKGVPDERDSEIS